jgi:hypothetical protein
LLSLQGLGKARFPGEEPLCCAHPASFRSGKDPGIKDAANLPNTGEYALKAMKREQLLDILEAWAERLLNAPDREEVVARAAGRNPWFTPEFSNMALDAVGRELLYRPALEAWWDGSPAWDQPSRQKNIGLVLAGNLPMVGFHDVLSVLLSGHRISARLSAKDDVLLPWALDVLADIWPGVRDRWHWVERLSGYDAVIATGSNNTLRYFQYYFGHKPNLLRASRSSAAVLRGGESGQELSVLARDVFAYFGMGCRSVSHLFLPPDYHLEQLEQPFAAYAHLREHSRYGHNVDYQRTLLLMNRTPHLGPDFYSLVESQQLFSPVSVIHYSYYRSEAELNERLDNLRDQLQVVVGRGRGWTPFGRAQYPGPADCADGVDTLDFLHGI